MKPGAAAPTVRSKTPDEVLAEFDSTGTSVSEWARDHGFHPNLVFEVLSGRVKARRGKSHKIAVLLGIKQGEVRT